MSEDGYREDLVCVRWEDRIDTAEGEGLKFFPFLAPHFPLPSRDRGADHSVAQLCLFTPSVSASVHKSAHKRISDFDDESAKNRSITWLLCL